ncbi:hypothetical protein ACIRSS_16135 [Amycolatopsis sp. NPDC101161]|uniref:hypothetical protein n=1 Tax=Amycolatopsis sp. NPDC101161 TaxID=3363940 RepID=UPI003807DBC5
MERAELVQELKTLRKGRGLAGRLEGRVGPRLRTACAVASDDGQVAIREKVSGRLTEWASDLPDDLRLAALAAFAICAEARQPLYQDRVKWAASRVDRDPRTVRRRVDEAIVLLAELASSSSTMPASSDQWHTSSLSLALALEELLVLEQRRIVADQDGLRTVDLAVSLPAGRPSVTVLYGGTLVDHGMETSSRWGYGLELPRPLSRGESLDYAILFRPPSLDSHMVCVPRHPCGQFDLRVRFGGAPFPPEVRVLGGAFQRDVSDPGFRGRPEPVDPSGEVHLRFRGLTPGLAYGARWESGL